MRRKDREVTDPQKITDVIRSCTCCRVGFADGGEVYIVPLNFGFEEKDGRRVFYFHGAQEGRKYELIQSKPTVGFELDANYALSESKTACGYTCLYQSVVGSGVIQTVEDPEEKRRALSLIMLQSTGKEMWEFGDATVKNTGIFRLDVTRLSCKEHQ